MITIRPVSPSDLILICNHRNAMFTEAGKPAADVAAMSPIFVAWLQPRLQDGRYFGFIAESLDGVPLQELG